MPNEPAREDVFGPNRKTSCAYWLRAVFGFYGHRVMINFGSWKTNAVACLCRNQLCVALFVP
jgi:hypothetical protein